MRRYEHRGQIKLANWPLGLEKDAAVIKLSPQEITRRTGATFERGEDGLDQFQATILKLIPGTVVAFQRYDNYPVDGTKVIIENGASHRFSHVVRLLKLEQQDFEWLSDDVTLQ